MTTVIEVNTPELPPESSIELDPRVALLQDIEASTGEVNEALSSLFLENYRTIGAIAARMGVPFQELDDVTQDVFLRAWRSRNTYKPTGKYGSWLARITRNVVLDRARKISISPSLADTDIELDHIALPNETVGSQYEFDDAFEHLLGKINPVFADALRLEQQGKSMKEIAEELGVPRNTVVTRIHRAKKALRAVLESGEVTF